MSDGINRHRSTRWLQKLTTSYGDEWNNDEESETEEFLPLEELLESTEDVKPLFEPFNTVVPEPNGVNEVLLSLQNTNLNDTPVKEEDLTSNKRASRFFVTNPDISDDETDPDNSALSKENKEVSSPLDDVKTSATNAEDDLVGETEQTAETEQVNEEEEVDHDVVSYDDIIPTAPLKVPSRVSSRNPSVDLDENNNDKLTTSRNEKLKSKDYANIDLVMNDYLNTYDENVKKDTEAVKEMESIVEDHGLEQDKNTYSNKIISEEVDHDHSQMTRDTTESSLPNELSVTPNDYNLSKSASSGSLSTGSWSMRSSSQFLNGPSSARNSFIDKLKIERRQSENAMSANDTKSDTPQLKEEPQDTGYFDSSSEDGDSIKFAPGQSINFGHWRPNTSTYGNDFIKDTNYDAESTLPTTKSDNDEYDDSYSMMTDDASLLFSGEEGHFFTKPLMDESFEDTLSRSTLLESDVASRLDFSEQFKSLAANDKDDEKSIITQQDDVDSNATETEQVDGEEDVSTDVDGSMTMDSIANTSVSTDGNGPVHDRHMQKQRYSSLVSLTDDASTPRQASLSSSVEPSSRIVSDAQSDVTRETSVTSESTDLPKQPKITSVRPFTAFDFKHLKALTNPENRITELRKMRKEETEVDTGLQEWLATELTKVSSSLDTYESLGPITLNAYKQLTPTTHLHSHSVTDMITRKHSINFGGVVGHGRLRLNKVGDHGGQLAKGIFNRGKKIMRNNSNGSVMEGK